MSRPLSLIGIAGAGLMGVGVAQCFAQAGHQVTVSDPVEEALATAPARLKAGLRLAALADRSLRSDPAETTAHIRWTADLDDLRDAEFVVECTSERPAIKEAVFRGLDAVCPAGTIFMSCTSAIPIATLAAPTGRPDRILGTHFMNPAPIKPAVEVIRAAETSAETLERTLDLLRSIGKKPIVVSDAPGFVTNRVLMLTINEAATVVHEGTASPVVVDQIFRDCFGHATGPLATADLIGLDTVLDTLVVLREHTGDPRFQPSPLLADLVREGRTGRKARAGFHNYS